MEFDAAFSRLIGHEGGYSNHAADPGGATRYGITEAVARSHGYTEDMRDLPIELARTIYKNAYWTAVRCDQLPAGIRFDVFDAAVNSGARQAAIWLQRAAKVSPDDGVIGPQTLAAVAACDPTMLRLRYNGQRLAFMASLPNWPAFSRGWARRIAGNLLME